jgi:hypothetical protein
MLVIQLKQNLLLKNKPQADFIKPTCKFLIAIEFNMSRIAQNNQYITPKDQFYFTIGKISGG